MNPLVNPAKLQRKKERSNRAKGHRAPSKHQLLRTHLSASSFSNYTKIMQILLQDYSEFEFCRTLSGYFRSKRFDLALSLADSLSAQKYADATSHFVANQFALLIRKYPWPPEVLNLDPEGAARRNFHRSERKCSLINRRFQIISRKGHSAYDDQLSKVRNFIQYVIGPEPDMEKIVQKMGFSAGASLGVHGATTHLAKKLSREKWSCTPGALTYAYWGFMNEPRLQEILCETNGTFSNLDFELARARYYSKVHIVSNNKLSYVLKDSKTHRVIGTEPLLSGFVQKGVDLVFRDNLKRVGIDLHYQKYNQQFAFLGSLTDDENSFVTIDLKGASDSISIGAVKFSFPPSWYELLNAIRSVKYELDGKLTVYQKFCSMGNGFCFPLETLLFTACCHAAGCGVPGVDFLVYGDDIIIRKKHVQETLQLLKLMGFSVNERKTFLEGPFRESCGADWFSGVDVRPFTLDFALDSVESIFKWLNLTRRSQLCEDFFSGVRSFVMELIPSDRRFIRPYPGPEDSAIDSCGNEFMASPHVSFNRETRLWEWSELVHKAVLDKDPHLCGDRRGSVDMYGLLSGFQPEDYTPAYTVRRTTRTSVTRISHGGSTSQWTPRHRDTVIGASALPPQKLPG